MEPFLVQNAVEPEHFTIKLRGGAWSASRRNMAVDSIRAECKSSLAKMFCENYHLSKRFTCSIDSAGSVEECMMLVKEWKYRMLFLIRYWEAFGNQDPAYIFPADVMQFYFPPDEVLEMALSRPNGRFEYRLTALRAMQPI